MTTALLLPNNLSQRIRGLRIFVSIMAIVSLILPDLALAAPRYWVGPNGGSNGEFNNTLNWSATEGGTSGASVPGASDVAIFDGKGSSGHIITIRQAVNVGGLIMTPSWTGSIFTGTSTLLLGGTGARIGSGRLVIGTGAVLASSGSITMTGGIVSNSLANHRLTTSGNILHLGGNFYYSGTLIFNNTTGDQTFAYRTIASSATQTAANHTFSGIILNNTAGTTIDDLLISGSTILQLRNLTITRGNFDLAGKSVALGMSGSITIANNAQSTFSTNSNVTISGSITTTGSNGVYTHSGGTLIINGARRSQVIDLNKSKIINLTVSNSSSGVLLSDMSVLGTLTINTGSVLALSGYTLFATGAAIVNYGTINEDTGVLSHTGSSFVVGDSNYSRLETFRQGNSVFITLTDADENIDGTTADTVTVTVTLASDGTVQDTETLTLTETALESGIFRGAIATANAAATSQDGTLQYTADGDINVTYTDAQDGLSNSQGAVFLVTGGSSTTSGGGGGGGRRGGGGGGGGGSGPFGLTVSRARPSLRGLEEETRGGSSTARGRTMSFADRIWSIVDRFEERLMSRSEFSQAEVAQKVAKLEERLQRVIDRRAARLQNR